MKESRKYPSLIQAFDKILSLLIIRLCGAEVAEMEDALHSGCSGRKPVGVRLPSSALFKKT